MHQKLVGGDVTGSYLPTSLPHPPQFLNRRKKHKMECSGKMPYSMKNLMGGGVLDKLADMERGLAAVYEESFALAGRERPLRQHLVEDVVRPLPAGVTDDPRLLQEVGAEGGPSQQRGAERPERVEHDDALRSEEAQRLEPQDVADDYPEGRAKDEVSDVLGRERRRRGRRRRGGDAGIVDRESAYQAHDDEPRRCHDAFVHWRWAGWGRAPSETE